MELYIRKLLFMSSIIRDSGASYYNPRRSRSISPGGPGGGVRFLKSGVCSQFPDLKPGVAERGARTLGEEIQSLRERTR